MTYTENAIRKLITRLENIAVRNDDKFRYSVLVEPCRRGLRFAFLVEEIGDNHIILQGDGMTIDDAVKTAEAQIPARLREWGYEE